MTGRGRSSEASGADTGMPGVFRTEGMPAQERFDCWREVIGQTRASEVTSSRTEDFEADMRRLDLGSVSLLRTSFSPARFWRTERMVRRSDPEVCHMTLLLDGDLVLTRSADRRQETFGRGSLHMVHSSHPFELQAHSARATARGERRVEALGIDFPASLLPFPPHQVRDLLGHSLPAREGTAALLPNLLLGLDRQAAALGPAEAPRLGTVVVDLVTTWLARELDARGAVPDDVRRRAMMESIRMFIQLNLHDPALSPRAIATVHHISVSYLHRLFTQHYEGETVAAWIRRRRLEKARRDLADPALRTMPIHAVAARWGIPRASDFSRAFQAAFGLSPSEHRWQALNGYADEGTQDQAAVRREPGEHVPS